MAEMRFFAQAEAYYGFIVIKSITYFCKKYTWSVRLIFLYLWVLVSVSLRSYPEKIGSRSPRIMTAILSLGAQLTFFDFW